MELEERKKEFYEKVGRLYMNTYSKQMLLEFCDYWTEHNDGGKKMRHEMEKVFNLGRRLSTWKRNTLKFNNDKQPITNEGLFEALNKALG